MFLQKKYIFDHLFVLYNYTPCMAKEDVHINEQHTHQPELVETPPYLAFKFMSVG